MLSAYVAYTSTNKTNRLNRDGFNFFFLPGVDAPHVYVRVWTHCRFQSYYYPNFSEGADIAGRQLHGDKEWRNHFWQSLPESDARSVRHATCPDSVNSSFSITTLG